MTAGRSRPASELSILSGEENEHDGPTTRRGVQGRSENTDDLGGLPPREAQGPRGEHDHEGPKRQSEQQFRSPLVTALPNARPGSTSGVALGRPL
jgi:hypothetical protein